METYTWMRAFADSWFLIAMTAFFVGQILWTLRPGSRATHADIAAIPLRNDTLEEETSSCSGNCGACACGGAAFLITPEETQDERA